MINVFAGRREAVPDGPSSRGQTDVFARNHGGMWNGMRPPSEQSCGARSVECVGMVCFHNLSLPIKPLQGGAEESEGN